ncbi:MAG: hypothetical protein KGL39_58255, partial [Patescibacteria group bacterium]|nr:hypothetical protein [Patescibacteria group bacterium]
SDVIRDNLLTILAALREAPATDERAEIVALILTQQMLEAIVHTMSIDFNAVHGRIIANRAVLLGGDHRKQDGDGE